MRKAFSSGAIDHPGPTDTRRLTLSTSIASRAQRVGTIAIRPSLSEHETRESLKVFCPTAKPKNFFERDWTFWTSRKSAYCFARRANHRTGSLRRSGCETIGTAGGIDLVWRSAGLTPEVAARVCPF